MASSHRQEGQCCVARHLGQTCGLPFAPLSDGALLGGRPFPSLWGQLESSGLWAEHPPGPTLHMDPALRLNISQDG